MKHTNEFILRRLLARSVVDESSPLVQGHHCRMWLRAERGGYGRLWDGEKVRDVHRLSFQVQKGPIPTGMDVLHHCDRPGCIEEAHLWAGTHAENMADRDAKGRHRNGAEKLIGRPSPVRGSTHVKAKLSEADARSIKRRLTGRARVKVSVIAAQYGVSPSLVSGIRDGRNWGWLK